MSGWLVITGAVGIAASILSLIGLGMSLAREGNYAGAAACIAGMGTIIFLTLLGIEYADRFWKG